jgi:hypothetical protein
MLLRSPQWLFLYPGLLLATIGAIGAAVLTATPIHLRGILTLDINALLYFSIATIVGAQITFFGLFAMAIARKMKLRIAYGIFAERLLRLASLEGAIAIGMCLVFAGLGGALYAILQWGQTSFGALIPSDVMRITIPAVSALAIGTQIVFGAFLLGFIDIE